MPVVADRRDTLTGVHTDLGAIFISMELSRSSWLITSLSPGNGEKMSKHVVRGGDVTGLLARFSQLKKKAQQLLLEQIKTVEAERDALLNEARDAATPARCRCC